jgi:hypothetical protein
MKYAILNVVKSHTIKKFRRVQIKFRLLMSALSGGEKSASYFKCFIAGVRALSTSGYEVG